jgi:hypothetical protein
MMELHSYWVTQTGWRGLVSQPPSVIRVDI